MKQIRLQMISPQDFEVIRVISFSDSHLNKNGVIVYRRPLTLNYNKDVNKDEVPIIYSFADEVQIRKFNRLTPLYNPKKKLFSNSNKKYSK